MKFSPYSSLRFVNAAKHSIVADLCKGLRTKRNFYALDAARRALTDSAWLISANAVGGQPRSMESITAFDGKLVTPRGRGREPSTYGCVAAAATSQMAQGCSGSGGVNTGDVHPPPRATISASDA